MSGARSRNKGARGERQTAKELSKAMEGYEVRRGIQNRTGGDAADIEGAGRLHVEVKTGKKPNPRAALAQAEADAKPGRIPMAVIRDDRNPPYVFMRWQTFLNEFLPLWAEKNKPVSELVNQVKG
tara:strand:- start:7010 stop:7384 length:375 start_codon:yes stop_codon:yes gene_type:complete